MNKKPLNTVAVTLPTPSLKDGELMSHRVDKRQVLIAKHGGQWKAMDDWCNHAGCLLSGGWIEKNMVVCPCHEVGFDLDTGKNMTSPSVCGDQRVFPIEEADGQLRIEASFGE